MKIVDGHIVKRKKRILRSLDLLEISAVTVPAQQGARMVLMKVAPDPGIIAKAIRAMDFDSVMEEQASLEVAHGISANVYAAWSVLQRSFELIASNDKLDAAQKIAAMRESLKQFIGHLREQEPDIAKALVAHLRSQPATTLVAKGLDATAPASRTPALAPVIHRKQETSMSRHDDDDDDDWSIEELEARFDELVEARVEKFGESEAIATDRILASAEGGLIKANLRALKRASAQTPVQKARRAAVETVEWECSEAEANLDALAAKLAKQHGVSIARAYDLALQTPDGNELYRETRLQRAT